MYPQIVISGAAEKHVAHRNIRPAPACRHVKRFKISRRDRVVGVDECDVLSVCGIKPRIPRRADSAVFLVYDPYPFVLFRVPVADFSASVGRAVVDEDQREVAVCLGKYAVEAAGEEFFNVVNRNDYRKSADNYLILYF